MSIGEKIRELRLEKDLLQRELAEKIHIAANTLSQFESGKANPSYEVLTALADFFEVSTDYLLGRADDFGVIQIQAEKKSADTLSTDEMQLIQDYRALTPALQEMLQATIQTWKGMSDSKTRPNRA